MITTAEDIIVRELPPEEWPRLRETGADLAQVQKAATKGDVIVVERDGEILACAVVLLCAHLEGCWVRQDQRGSMGVTGKLWRAVKQAIAAFGATGFVGCAVSDSSDHMMQSLGGEMLQGRHYVIGLTHGRL